MLRNAALAGLLALGIASPEPRPFGGAPSEGASADFNAIEQSLARAWIERDEKTIDGLLAPDWTVIDIGGRILTKAEVLKEARTQERQIDTAAIDEVRVRSLGDVAVVTGRNTVTGSYRGTRASVTLRFTDVFSRQGGRWVIVASQGTSIALSGSTGAP